jgi:hypothetical protein
VLSSAGHLRNWKILQIYQNFILDNKNKLYKLQKKNSKIKVIMSGYDFFPLVLTLEGGALGLTPL